MKEYPTEQIRNVALAGHQGAGKTSLVEALLFVSGATSRMGRIADGTTVSDYDEDEKNRHLSIGTAITPIEFNGCKINLMDTPGYPDFQGEVKNAVRVSDCVLIAVDAVAGPEVGTELAWQFAEEFNQPVIIVVNKINRENASFERTLQALRVRFPGYKFVPSMLPIGQGPGFKGVVNVLTKKAYYGTGSDEQRTDAPADMHDQIEAAHTALIEAAAEASDELINKYFETQELSFEEVRDGMRMAARDANLKTVPVFVAAGDANIGTAPLLEAMTVYVSPPSNRRVALASEPGEEVEFLQPPQSDDGPLAAFVFKTSNDRFVGTLSYFRVFSGHVKSGSTYYNANTEQEERLGQLLILRGKEQIPVPELHAGDIGAVAKLTHTHTGDTLCGKDKPLTLRRPIYPDPVYAVALDPRTQADGTKMGVVLTQLNHADPTLRWRQDSETKQTVLEGMGDIHIAVALSRADRMGCGLTQSMPRVPYREAITKTASAQHRHKKQSGGAGQFGEVHLRVEPRESGEGFEFQNKVVGGAISGSFIPSIEKGIRSVLDQGVLAGYPIYDIRAVVTDGKMHPVDSKDIAFQIAGRESFKLAFMEADPVLMEPIMDVRVVVPEENMGDILGDLNTRRGRVQGMDTENGRSIVTAQVPLSEMLRYSNELRSMTGGRGVYTMRFAHYEHVPAHIAQPIIAAHSKTAEVAES
ncbi:MAG: elongation factor G [Aggregatilineales bacterium]